MEKSYRQRFDLVSKIKNAKIDLSKINVLSTIGNDQMIRKIYFKKLIGTLVEADTFISVCYDTLQESDWSNITSNLNTPIENKIHKKLREKYQTFASSFCVLYENIASYDFDSVLAMFDRYIILNKSRNIQFILFALMEINQNAVLSFFCEKINEANGNIKTYLTYFFSLIIRFRLEEKASQKCLKLIKKLAVNYLENHPNRAEFVHFSQLILYLCCFKKEFVAEVPEFINYIFNEEYVQFMNKNIVEVFCEKHNRKTPSYFEDECAESLNYFPLDKSIFERINGLIEQNYMEWTD